MPASIELAKSCLRAFEFIYDVPCIVKKIVGLKIQILDAYSDSLLRFA